MVGLLFFVREKWSVPTDASVYLPSLGILLESHPLTSREISLSTRSSLKAIPHRRRYPRPVSGRSMQW